jgi:hypothetical protein
MPTFTSVRDSSGSFSNEQEQFDYMESAKDISCCIALVLLAALGAAPANLSAQSVDRLDFSHIMHTSNRDEGFRGVTIDLDVVDGLSKNQKTIMMDSYRQQYQSNGYDLKHLPEIDYFTAVINLASGKKIGSSVFTITTETQSGTSVKHALMMIGIDGAIYHKMLCSGVTNVFIDPACLEKAQSVFGKMTVNLR